MRCQLCTTSVYMLAIMHDEYWSSQYNAQFITNVSTTLSDSYKKLYVVSSILFLLNCRSLQLSPHPLQRRCQPRLYCLSSWTTKGVCFQCSANRLEREIPRAINWGCSLSTNYILLGSVNLIHALHLSHLLIQSLTRTDLQTVHSSHDIICIEK